MPSRPPIRSAAFCVLATGVATLACSGLESPIDFDETVYVMVGARDLYAGVVITEADLVAIEVPVQLLPGGVFLDPADVVGRIPKERILHMDLIRAERLSDPENGTGIHALVPMGMRALALPGHGTAVSPRQRVDVWTTGDGACAIAYDLPVLSVNGELDGTASRSADQLTVLVMPAQMPPLLSAAPNVEVMVRSNQDPIDQEHLCSR